MFLGVEAFYITLLDTHPLSFSPTLFHKKFHQWSKETSQINMLILSLCVQKKELWVGFYDHECCEFVSPFIPLFVLMTMVVVVNCVTIPILCCWGWGCCEWCDNSFHSCCGVVVNCVMIHSIVCCCVVDDNCCCGVVWWLIDPKCCGVVDVYCCELCDYDSFILRLLMVVCLAVVGEQTNQRVFLHNSQKEQPLVCLFKNSRTTFVCFLKSSGTNLFLVEET
jgi:hypothetical protein